MINPSVAGEYSVKVSAGFRTGDEGKESGRVFATRYNFKPDSVDDSKSSVLSRSGSEYVLESPGVQNESFVFSGQSTETKDVDCVLVYDEATNGFVLHHLSAIIRLKPQRSVSKKQSGGDNSSRHAHSLSASSNSSGSASATSSLATSPVKAKNGKPASDRVISLPSFTGPVGGGSEKEKQASGKRTGGDEVEVNEVEVEKSRPTSAASVRSTKSAPAIKKVKVDKSSSDEVKPNSSIPAEAEESSDDSNDPPAPPPISNYRRPVPVPVSSASTRVPISLRGYNGGGRVEDDISSSSEEE
ncbi:RNA polymerase II transcription elongation factor-domain-containing protein [Lipomyces arxii]|uniref:RNA polymerase II transcription elongation factor-domain-containing protein n=1 Tax=Lipomyces arxii TaxID=56418 RepID=UPI0034D01303